MKNVINLRPLPVLVAIRLIRQNTDQIAKARRALAKSMYRGREVSRD